MRVISRTRLIEYWTRTPGARQGLAAWLVEAEHARWTEPAQIRERYRSADFLPGNRVVFNIQGNSYRLVVAIHYNTGVVFIRFVGTHAAYNRIGAETI